MPTPIYTPLPPGTFVTLRGLIARPELNGRTGKVLDSSHSAEAKAGYAKGRVPVQLNGETKPMLLKPEALEVTKSADDAAPPPLRSLDDVKEPRALRNGGPKEWTDYTYDQLCSMGQDYFAKGTTMVAIECLQVAIEMEPKSFTAYWQLGQVYEAGQEVPFTSVKIPGSGERAANLYLKAMENAAPESATPQYNEWCNAFVRAANLLTGLPSAQKPPWWCPTGIKQHCGVVLKNPQGLLPDSDLLCPGWRLMAHAFEMDNDPAEAAKCYEEAAGYSMDPEVCKGLMSQAAKLRSQD